MNVVLPTGTILPKEGYGQFMKRQEKKYLWVKQPITMLGCTFITVFCEQNTASKKRMVNHAILYHYIVNKTINS